MSKWPVSAGGLFVPGRILSRLLRVVLIWPLTLCSLPGYATEVPAGEWRPIRDLNAAPDPRPAAIGHLPECQMQAASITAVTGLPARLLRTPPAVSVIVGHSDTSRPSANLSKPRSCSPNTILIGGDDPTNAGAVRRDNPSGAPLTIDTVLVDLQKSNDQFNLWGNFTIPTGGSAILTQTQTGNFDSSAFSIGACGGALPNGETRTAYHSHYCWTISSIRAYRARARYRRLRSFMPGQQSLQWAQSRQQRHRGPSGSAHFPF